MACVAVVDPISTGAFVAHEAHSRGFAVVAVWCSEVGDLRAHVPEAAKVPFLAEVDEASSLEETAQLLQKACHGVKLEAVMVGGESGVTLADSLSEFLGLRTNGTQFGARRNKSVQQKLVRQSGLRAVREVCTTQWKDVEAFLENEPLPVVVKPVESAGSDGVKLCRSVEETHDHFHLLMNSQRAVGSQGAAVLCQEFLAGTEYVVDHVSRDGVHKTVMVWRYDKRPANGSQFVYFGMVPEPSDSEIAQVLIKYTRGVLDALGIQHGPTHGEVMMTRDGPCLVEMNCRCHGGDGSFLPLAQALTGYTQVDGALDSFVDSVKFDAIPDAPPTPFKAGGQEVILVSMFAGLVLNTPGFRTIQEMPSFHSLETSVKPGVQVKHTVDMFTGLGSVILIHADPDVVSKDIDAIRQMELDGKLFDLAPAMHRIRTCSEEVHGEGRQVLSLVVAA
jgi:biotin carboxylase